MTAAVDTDALMASMLACHEIAVRNEDANTDDDACGELCTIACNYATGILTLPASSLAGLAIKVGVLRRYMAPDDTGIESRGIQTILTDIERLATAAPAEGGT